MTAKASATQAQIRRAIAAARKEGLRVAGIRADGTVLVHTTSKDDVAPSIAPSENATSSEWEEFRP